MNAEPRIYRYTHQAMRCEWEFLIFTDDPTYAGGACEAVFADINRIEEELSRFKPHSDIGRLRATPAGEAMNIGLATCDVLAVGKDVWQATDRAFDMAIGPLYELWRNRNAVIVPPTEEELAEARSRSGSHLFEVDVEAMTATPLIDGLQLDPGAIGKGYALDQAAVQLKEEWKLSSFLLTAAGSSVISVGPGPEGEGWRVNAGPEGGPPILLRDKAISASGFTYQGSHIINPRTGLPVSTTKKRIWAIAPNATLSDALSTAFLVMEREEIEAFCTREPDIEVLYP